MWGKGKCIQFKYLNSCRMCARGEERVTHLCFTGSLDKLTILHSCDTLLQLWLQRLQPSQPILISHAQHTSTVSVLCSAPQLRWMYSNTLGWQWQHFTVNTIMHLSRLFPSSSSCLDSELALTLAHCLYLSLYHFLLSPLPARSSDLSLTYCENGDGTEPMLIVCFSLRAAECVCVRAIDMRTSIKGSSRSRGCSGLRLATATVRFIQICG